jgi:hypothetical protein
MEINVPEGDLLWSSLIITGKVKNSTNVVEDFKSFISYDLTDFTQSLQTEEQPQPLTCIPTHFACRARQSFQIAAHNRTLDLQPLDRNGQARKQARKTTNPITSTCPNAIGKRAWRTAICDFFCNPNATANSHPIPGFIPCHAPSRSRVNHGHCEKLITLFRQRSGRITK